MLNSALSLLSPLSGECNLCVSCSTQELIGIKSSYSVLLSSISKLILSLFGNVQKTYMELNYHLNWMCLIILRCVLFIVMFFIIFF